MTAAATEATRVSRAREIIAAAGFLFRPGDVAEIRAPKAGKEKTISGYASDPQILAKLALAADRKAQGIYWTINLVNPALKARAADKLKPYAEQTTADHDIVTRRNLLLDIDAVRPSGISSTDAEHRAALDLARVIRRVLMALGWPEPLFMDSGNGAYLIFRLPDLPNDESSLNLVKAVLRALGERFDTAAAKIDQSPCNAARIAKIPGTHACKGDSTADRPHRVSLLLDVPERAEPVPLELLEQMAATAKPAEAKTKPAGDPASGTTTAGQWIDNWLARSGIEITKGPYAKDGGRQWDVRCPFDPEHGDRGDASVFQGAGGKLGFHCFHQSCAGNDWRALRARTEGPNQANKNGQPADPPPADWENLIPLQSRAVPAIRAEWIPGALGDMAAAVAKATETPLEMAALLGVPVVSCCLAGKVEIDVETGYSEPPITYVVPAMESGARKTAVLAEMLRPLSDHDSAERRRLEPEITRAINKRKTIEAQIDALRKKAARSPANTTLVQEIEDVEKTLPDVPRAPVLWTQDATTEKLARLMQDNGERMGVFSDEGGLFDILGGRYNGGVPNFDIFLHGHSASPVRVHRVSSPDVYLNKPMLSVGLSPQPGVLEHLRDTPAFRHRGLLARFLYALPPSSLGDRKLTPHPCPDAVRDAYRELIIRLIQLTPPMRDGAWQPWRLKFSEEAYDAWKQFQRDVESMMREGGKLERLRDWGGKLPGQVVRLAGVFHAVVVEDLARDLVISRDTIDCAIKLGTALIDHALAVFDLMERDPTFEGAQKILEWIRRGRRQTFTQRECFCAHQSRFRRVAAIRPALALLVEHSYLRRVPQASVSNRPSENFEVNPQLLGEKA